MGGGWGHRGLLPWHRMSLDLRVSLNMKVVALWAYQTQQQEENTPGNTKDLLLSSSILMFREVEFQLFPEEPQLSWNHSFIAAPVQKSK